jgi:hypothetical protein
MNTQGASYWKSDLSTIGLVHRNYDSLFVRPSSLCGNTRFMPEIILSLPAIHSPRRMKANLDACRKSGVNGVVAKSIDQVALLAKLGGV